MTPASLDETLLDALTKGFAPTRGPVRLGDVGAAGLNVLREDLLFPVAVLKQSALDNNARWMRAFVARTGALLAPHGKTTMSPQLFARQLEDGAWAMTVATVQQLMVAHRFGVRRVVLANQLVGKEALRSVVALLAGDPGFALFVLADSLDGVAALATATHGAGLARPLSVLAEVGFTGGRTGCRTPQDTLAVARAVAAAPSLALVGIEAFEGLIHSDDVPEDERRVRALLTEVVAAARACEAEALFAPGPVLLSAGGSAYYDLVTDVLGASGVANAQVLLRCGCTVTHDHGVYAHADAHVRRRLGGSARGATGGALEPALEIWAAVQSRPEPGRAILTVGKRDVSYDMDLPIVLGWTRAAAPLGPLPGHDVVELNDQHAHVRLPHDSPLRTGDLVCLGISHPCTTFDKWPVLFVVNDAYDVIGAVRTFF